VQLHQPGRASRLLPVPQPHFCRAALAAFGAQDIIALVRSHGIPFHEKTLGQLFCDDSAADIIDMLGRECERARCTGRGR